jgi:ankyrin repeat protein
MFGRSKAEKNKKLLKAIAENNYEMILKAVAHGADVNTKDKNGNTAFILAYSGVNKVIDKAVGTLNFIGMSHGKTYDETVLHLSDNNPFYTAIIEQSIETNKKIRSEMLARAETELSEAVKNRVKIVKAMIAAGADVQVKGDNGQTALIDAAARGEENIFRALVDAHADVNAKNNAGDSALILAAKYGQVELVKILIEKGADVNAANVYGENALMMAVSRKCHDTVKALLDNNADINAVNHNGDSILLKAVATGDYMLVKDLLEKGAEVNAKNAKGQCPLMVAVRLNKKAVIDALLEKDAYLENADQQGDTPLIVAAKLNCLETVKKLTAKGANVNARNSHGDTALIVGSYNGCKQTIEFLVTHGADIKATNNDGYSALSNLLKDDKKHYAIIELLQKQLEQKATTEAAQDHIFSRTVNIGRGDQLKETFNFMTRERTQAYFSSATQSWTPETTESFDEIANAQTVLRDAFDKYRAAGGTLTAEVLIPHKKQARRM